MLLNLLSASHKVQGFQAHKTQVSRS